MTFDEDYVGKSKLFKNHPLSDSARLAAAEAIYQYKLGYDVCGIGVSERTGNRWVTFTPKGWSTTKEPKEDILAHGLSLIARPVVESVFGKGANPGTKLNIDKNYKRDLKILGYFNKYSIEYLSKLGIDILTGDFDIKGVYSNEDVIDFITYYLLSNPDHKMSRYRFNKIVKDFENV